MPEWNKIKEVIIGVIYGSIDQKLSQREKLTYGFGGLIIAVAAQVALAWLLIPSSGATIQIARLSWWVITNKSLLNIIVFPFQLIGILSLIYVVQGFTKYPFGRDSFWSIETEKHVPFFIRARAFLYQPYFIVFVISEYLAVYMDYTTKFEHFYFWFVYHNIVIFLVIIVANWLKIFLEKFENAIISIRSILPDENEFKNYKRFVRSETFNIKEVAVIFLITFVLVKVSEMLFSDGTWKGGSGYVFPLTALWISFSVNIILFGSWLACSSVAYVYRTFFLTLNHLKNKKLHVFLFHSDGCAGLGKIIDLIYSNITKVLFIISILTFFIFLAISFSMQTDPTDSAKYQMLWVTVISDSLVLVIFLSPLREIRSVIKRKKEDERRILLERIKQKEEACLERCLEIKEFQEIEYSFNLIKRIDAIHEWGIGSRQWLTIFSRVLLTFNGVALQELIKYLNK